MRAAAARVLERLEVEAEARGVRVTPDIDPVA
jgi:hypothetical protein